MRNLLMGILQVRYGYEKVKPDVVRGDFLERSIFVARDEFVRGIKPIASEILAAEDPDLRAKKIQEAEETEKTEARKNFVSEVSEFFSGHGPDVSMQPHSMPLTPNFRAGGITVYRQVLGLVTFKDKQAKLDALNLAEKAQSDDEAGEQTLPRVSLQAKDTTDVALLTQLSEAELRQNLRSSDEQFIAAQGHGANDSNSDIVNATIVAAMEQVHRAAKALGSRRREYNQAAAQLEQTKHKEPAYSARWDEVLVADKTESDHNDNDNNTKEVQSGPAFSLSSCFCFCLLLILLVTYAFTGATSVGGLRK